MKKIWRRIKKESWIFDLLNADIYVCTQHICMYVCMYKIDG